MEQSQKRSGEPLETKGAGVHAHVWVICPEPRTVGEPVEHTGNPVAESVVVAGLIEKGAGEGKKKQKKVERGEGTGKTAEGFLERVGERR